MLSPTSAKTQMHLLFFVDRDTLATPNLLQLILA